MVRTLFGTQAKPFLKWAGGKGQLIPEIDKRLPEEEIRKGKITTYVEPFVGGGAVFFHIAGQFPEIKRFYLFDINQDLVNCYNAIKNNVEELIDELKILDSTFKRKRTTRKDFFYQIRTEFNSDHDPAKLIFLNKTCFNGLYRVNKKGEFNVPFGDNKSPKICDEENLYAVSKILQKARIKSKDFEECEPFIGDKAFVYFDPPYRPISPTATFTSYTKENFGIEAQIRLSKFCLHIHKRGARFLLSNSDPKNENPKDHFFEKHYSSFTIDRVNASRVINCKGARRGKIKELLVINY
jgi:DNA adenine methylase